MTIGHDDTVTCDELSSQGLQVGSGSQMTDGVTTWCIHDDPRLVPVGWEQDEASGEFTPPDEHWMIGLEGLSSITAEE